MAEPELPLALPRPGVPYAETADSGGWDECFPTVGASPIPGAAPGTPPLLDHGELWRAEWKSSVYEHADGTTLSGTARGVRLPYEFQRDVTLDFATSRSCASATACVTPGAAPFPWIWSAHPLFNVQPGTTLDLPGVHQVRLGAVHGRDDLRPDDVGELARRQSAATQERSRFRSAAAGR